MPPIQYTPYTNNEEVAAIYEQYRTGDAPDAPIDWAAMEADIIDGANDYGISIEDLVAAYALGTSTWTDNIMAPESFIGSPDAFPLWEDERVLTTLRDLRDDLPDGMGAAIDHFLVFADANGGVHTEGVLSQIQSLIAELSNRPDEEDSEGEEEGAGATQEGFFDLMIPEDLDEVRHHFMASGNIGMALLLQAAYSTVPKVNKMIDKVNDDMLDKFTGEYEDLLDDMEDAGRNADDPQTSVDLQVISQKISVVTQLIQITNQITEALRKIPEEQFRRIADTSDQRNQTIEFMIARM